MSRTPEAKVKAKVVKYLKALPNCYYFFPSAGGYGKSGVPDIICCCNGEFVAIECKAGHNKPTALQMKNIRDIQDAGGTAWVVNEENVEEVAAVLQVWYGE